ncbi:hypothetical protein C8F04DRAFT_1202047 [Mycena alexandri]|uniref:F-box domain-containing protein n=1 Tax=Mycena alexandri TaxID=1745969 RepID=A0AAD6RW99_9AGAR|nr:hypothetical protein C8F04DRAFT_1202047 [Mycena alexandri]
MSALDHDVVVQIVSFGDAKSDLKNWATVSRDWTHPVQVKLFRTVNLVHWDASTQVTVTGLQMSAHLQLLIRHITLAVSAPLLCRVTSMGLINLVSCAIIGDVGTQELVQYVRAILQIGSLERVRLAGNFGSTDVLSSVFELHSSKIKHVDVLGVLFNGVAPAVSTFVHHSQTRLESLAMSNISLEWTQTQHFPFILAQLSRIRTAKSTDNMPFDVGRVQCLQIINTPQENTFTTLPRFSAVTYLHVDVHAAGFPALLGALNALPAPRPLEHLSVSTHLDVISSPKLPAWRTQLTLRSLAELDEGLLRIQLPMLKVVRMRPWRALTDAQIVVARQSMPGLESRMILHFGKERVAECRFDEQTGDEWMA